MRTSLYSILIVSMSLFFVDFARAQDLRTYTVQEGDTCGSIARRFFGNSRAYGLIHENNPNLGPMPHRLQPGMTLRIPNVDGSQRTEATVSAVRRQVDSQPPAQPSWDRAWVGQELRRGWRVNTRERSSAELTFRESSVAQIREETLVVVYAGRARQVRQEGARAVVRRGAILSRLSSLSGGQPLEVETPSSRATLRPGETGVSVEESGTSRIMVHNGDSASVRTLEGRGEISVPAGMGTKVLPGRRPSRPRPLPRAPTWSADAPVRFLGIGRAGGTLRGRWDAVPRAVRYRIEVAKREDGRELMLSADVNSDIRSFEFHNVPADTYYVRISTVDDDLFEGRPSEPIVVTILDVGALAPGALLAPPREPSIEEIDALNAELDLRDFDARAPGPTVLLQHTKLHLPEGIRCGLDEGPKLAELALEELGGHILRCEADADVSVDDIPIRVAPLEIGFFTDDGSEPLLRRGSEQSLRVALRGENIEDGNFRIVGADGVEVGTSEGISGGLRFRTNTPMQGPPRATFRVVTADDAETLMASFTLPVSEVETEPEPSPEPVMEENLPSVTEAFGLSAYPGWVGLRDERRRGSSAQVDLSFLPDSSPSGTSRFRISTGARASFLEERLRFDVQVPIDAYGGVPDNYDQRGSRDIYVGVSSLVIDDGPMGLAAEVGAWMPTAGADQGGLLDVRMRVDVDFSYRLLDQERLILRTRQSALIDLMSPAGGYWASAYGADYRVVGPLLVGGELDMVLGKSNDDVDLSWALGLGASVGVDLGPVVLSLGGRYALPIAIDGDSVGGPSSQRRLGEGMINLNVRGSYDLWGAF